MSGYVPYTFHKDGSGMVDMWMHTCMTMNLQFIQHVGQDDAWAHVHTHGSISIEPT